MDIPNETVGLLYRWLTLFSDCSSPRWIVGRDEPDPFPSINPVLLPRPRVMVQLWVRAPHEGLDQVVAPESMGYNSMRR